MSRSPDRARRTRRLLGTLAVMSSLAAAAQATAPGAGSRFNLGRTPTDRQIAAWDIDVRPDGHGLRTGKGSVVEGQVVYDAQCASCHGTFGESTTYLAIAGGVRKSDLETGRASVLRESDGLRTLGTKLNHVTTLWDYINRAMPWANPQSLSVDQVYAVTAYVLHLNGIVAGDFVLSDANIRDVALPNRNGMTMQHGLGRIDGKPDAQGSNCMKDCAAKVVISSEMPEYARNQHGDLAQQQRTVGPMRGIDTTGYGIAPIAASSPSAKSASALPEDLLTRNACTACHGVSNKVVGPSFKEIAAKYEGRGDAVSYLSGKIVVGGQGVWGEIPMPPQPGVKPEEAQVLARWILGGTR